MIDIKEIKNAINFMAKEKNIEKEKIIEIIEAAIKTAYKKDYGDKDEEVKVKLDLEEETLFSWKNRWKHFNRFSIYKLYRVYYIYF